MLHAHLNGLNVTFATGSHPTPDRAATAWTSPRAVRLRWADVWKPLAAGGHVQLTLSTNTLPGTVVVTTQHVAADQLLSSALQKAVRRSQPDAAMRAARTLAMQSPNLFLRRLVIVVTEDAFLHDSVALVVWLMVATSLGYVWTSAQRDQCLALVEWCARQPWIERHVDSRDDVAGIEHWKQLVAGGTVPPALWAMAVRISYGGMPGDIRLLWRLVRRWSHRLRHSDPVQIANDALTLTSSCEPYTSKWQVPLESVDFHVGRGAYMVVLRQAIERAGHVYDERTAQSAVWQGRSGVYVGKQWIDTRTPWTPTDNQYYRTVVAPLLDQVARDYLAGNRRAPKRTGTNDIRRFCKKPCV